MFRKSLGVIVSAAILLGAVGQTRAQSAAANFTVRIENISGAATDSAFKTVGIFNKAIGAPQPGAAAPSSSFEFTVNAIQGDRLSFTTMFGQSNDWFFGVSDKGLALYDDAGKPISGDFSKEIQLWNTGSEVDEEPGMGPNQGPRQGGPNTGPAENGTVSLVSEIKADITKPNAADYLTLTVTPKADNQFTVRIDNISANAVVLTPISPGVYVIHTGDAPIFTAGQPDRDQGLEQQSEDGSPIRLARSLGVTDKVAHISPGVFVVHTEADPLFTVGQPDRGQGLEAQAEDGKPTTLAESVKAGMFATTGVYNMPVGAKKAGPLGPGQAFEYSFDATMGDYLSFTSMFGDSNDLFFAPDGHGIALFNAKGKPISGDVTIHIRLWDAGTEVNQEPFVGADQAPRQAAPNTGAAESKPVSALIDVKDGFAYPSVYGMIKVTITAKDGVVMNMMDPAMMQPADGMMAATPEATATN